MLRAVLMMTVLITAEAPDVMSTETSTSPASSSRVIMPSVPPFKSAKTATVRPRKKVVKGKSESPMLNYIFDSYATSNKHFHDKFKAPSFEGNLGADDSSIEADTGATVYFDCKVASLRDKLVSWLKVSDSENLELLTLDLDTHTADSRYRVDLEGENWRLQLSDAKVQDSGVYCCHVSTHPPMLKRVHLTVHPPEMRLSTEAFLETGETLSLKCSVVHLSTSGRPPRLVWVKGGSTEPLDEARGGVLVDTDRLAGVSKLQVASLRPEDAGNYTCILEDPIQMRATTRVHVLQGSSLAELQSGGKTAYLRKSLLCVVIVVVCVQNLLFEGVHVR